MKMLKKAGSVCMAAQGILWGSISGIKGNKGISL